MSLRWIFCVGLCLLCVLTKGQSIYQKGNLIPLRELTFDPGKSRINLQTSNLQQLNELAVALQQMPDMKISVIGHTDVIGDVRLNKELSEDRAIAIKYYLMGLGISKKRIKTIGMGGTDPIIKEGSPLNRRIEVKVLENTERILSAPVVVHAVPDSATKVVTAQPSQKPALRKVALVIGNSDYKTTGKLKNPSNDVDLIDRTLHKLNFEVQAFKNLTHQKMMEAIREFTLVLNGADVVFFYYAGHGLQHNGNNYLLPIDAALKNGAQDLQFEAINAEIILKILEYTNKESLNVIVLDACRNNPYANWTRSAGGGLIELKPPSGSVIAYATSPGSVAFDGDGTNGVYTAALAEELLKPQRLEDVFMKTRLVVEKKTDGAQSPWELLRLRGVYQLSE